MLLDRTYCCYKLPKMRFNVANELTKNKTILDLVEHRICDDAYKTMLWFFNKLFVN